MFYADFRSPLFSALTKPQKRKRERAVTRGRARGGDVCLAVSERIRDGDRKTREGLS